MLSGVLIVYPDVFRDDRGYFFESYHQKKYLELGIPHQFVQDNQSYSTYGTIRGLHFQKGQYAQAKLVRVIQGTILDIVVDINPESPTFTQHVAIELDGEKQNQIFVPSGYAHGFSVLSKTAIVEYKCDNFYNPTCESGVIYNDPSLGIDWKIPVKDQIISGKDQKLLPLES